MDAGKEEIRPRDKHSLVRTESGRSSTCERSSDIGSTQNLSPKRITAASRMQENKEDIKSKDKRSLIREERAVGIYNSEQIISFSDDAKDELTKEGIYANNGTLFFLLERRKIKGR